MALALEWAILWLYPCSSVRIPKMSTGSKNSGDPWYHPFFLLHCLVLCCAEGWLDIFCQCCYSVILDSELCALLHICLNVYLLQRQWQLVSCTVAICEVCSLWGLSNHEPLWIQQVNKAVCGLSSSWLCGSWLETFKCLPSLFPGINLMNLGQFVKLTAGSFGMDTNCFVVLLLLIVHYFMVLLSLLAVLGMFS